MNDIMKAVAFDLDDTLLHDDLSISDFTVQTLCQLHAAGIYIVPASGRAQLSMLPLISRFDCSDLYIASNGAELWDGKTHQQLRQITFSTDIAREIVAFGQKHHCYMHTYEGDHFLFSETSHWAELYASVSLLKGVLIRDLDQYVRKKPGNKILMVDDAGKISALLKEAQVLFQGRVSVTSSKANYLEFNPLEATKGYAMKQAAEILQISVSDFIAFGDSLNDLSMLDAAGLSVAVRNGRPEVQAHCRFLCGTNNEDGVARFLRKHFSMAEVEA